jgi:hypothetical protein
LFIKKNPAMAIIGKKQEVGKKNIFDQDSDEELEKKSTLKLGKKTEQKEVNSPVKQNLIEKK